MMHCEIVNYATIRPIYGVVLERDEADFNGIRFIILEFFGRKRLSFRRRTIGCRRRECNPLATSHLISLDRDPFAFR